jgi:DNA replication protein DnaC
VTGVNLTPDALRLRHAPAADCARYDQQEHMIMERTEVLDLMGQLKLFGMKGAYDEILATALKRRHEPPRFAGDLLKAEIAEKQARSIRYQLTIAKLPLAKDIDGFMFQDTPINESLVRDLDAGGFIAQQRNVVMIGGIGTGKTHLATARSGSRSSGRGRPDVLHRRQGG